MLLWLSRETPAVNARTTQNRPPCGGASHRGLRDVLRVGGPVCQWQNRSDASHRTLTCHSMASAAGNPLARSAGFFTFPSPHPAPASPSRTPFFSLTDTPCHSVPFRPSLPRKAVSKEHHCIHTPPSLFLEQITFRKTPYWENFLKKINKKLQSTAWLAAERS